MESSDDIWDLIWFVDGNIRWYHSSHSSVDHSLKSEATHQIIPLKCVARKKLVMTNVSVVLTWFYSIYEWDIYWKDQKRLPQNLSGWKDVNITIHWICAEFASLWQECPHPQVLNSVEMSQANAMQVCFSNRGWGWGTSWSAWQRGRRPCMPTWKPGDSSDLMWATVISPPFPLPLLVLRVASAQRAL